MVKIHSPIRTLTFSRRRLTVLLLSVVVLAVLIEPAYVAETPGWLNTIYRFFKYIVSAGVIIAFFLRRSGINSLFIGAILFEGCLFLSTAVKGGDLRVWFSDCAYALILLLFTQMAVSIDRVCLFNALSIVLGIYVHINTLTWILWPDGLYTNSLDYRNCWFLGYDNVAVIIVFLAEIMALYNILSGGQKRLKFWEISVIGSGIVFIFGSGVGTAIIVELAVLIFLLLTSRKRIRSVIGNAKVIVIVMLAAFLMFQFLNVQGWRIFDFLYQITGKNATFTGRTKLWSLAWEDLLPNGNLLFGFGMRSGEELTAHFGSRFSVHLHSYYLQVLYNGGLLAFGSFIFILLDTAGRFDRGEKDFRDMVLLAGLLGMMLMWQVEAYHNLIRLFFLLMVILYHNSRLKSFARMEPVDSRTKKNP